MELRGYPKQIASVKKAKKTATGMDVDVDKHKPMRIHAYSRVYLNPGGNRSLVYIKPMATYVPQIVLGDAHHGSAVWGGAVEAAAIVESSTST